MQKKYKILFIQKDGILGGSAISLLLLLRYLKNKNIKFMLILCQKGELLNELKKLHIQYKIINFKGWRNLKNIFINLYAIIKLKIFLLFNDFNVIHSNSYEVNPLMILAAGKKYLKICHVRDYIDDRRAKKFLLQKADLIISVSKAVTTKLKNITKIKTIYNGATEYKLEKKDYIKNIIKKNKNGFIYAGVIGSCEKRKRQKDFIDAAFTILKKDKKFRFFIIGNLSSNYCLSLKKSIPAKYKNHIFFISHQKDIIPIINTLDIIIITSSEEAFGRTAIEAMSLKKPVIGTKVGGIPEIVKHNINGYLYPVGNIQLLAKYILKLKDKNLRNKLGNNGYLIFKKKFTEEKYINNIIKIYENFKK